MFHLKAPQIYLLLGVVVVLVADNHSFARQFETQRLIKDDLGAEELALSLVVNQMALLQILNESSTICPKNGRQQLKILELDLKTEELKNELLAMKTSALNELQDMKTTTLNEITMANDEAIQDVLDLKEAAFNLFQTRGTTKGKRFRKYEGPATQPQALQACQQLGGRLALITSDEETKQIRSEVGLNYPGDIWSYYYWISGAKDRDGNWIDSVTRKPMIYTNFRHLQPDNSGGNQNCLTIAPSYLGWDDRDCDHIGTGYVCQFINE